LTSKSAWLAKVLGLFVFIDLLKLIFKKLSKLTKMLYL
jgi:hypothetical protein